MIHILVKPTTHYITEVANLHLLWYDPTEDMSPLSCRIYFEPTTPRYPCENIPWSPSSLKQITEPNVCRLLPEVLSNIGKLETCTS